MIANFKFWLSKVIANVTLSLSIGFFVALYYIFFALFDWWRQRKCDHKKIRENRGGHAICSDCNKNLGSIGEWQEKQAGKMPVSEQSERALKTVKLKSKS